MTKQLVEKTKKNKNQTNPNNRKILFKAQTNKWLKLREALCRKNKFNINKMTSILGPILKKKKKSQYFSKLWLRKLPKDFDNG